MPPHKNEITLVVECHHLSSFKLGYLRNQCLEHATNSVTKSGIEVVQDELRIMCCHDAFALDDDTCQFPDTIPIFITFIIAYRCLFGRCITTKLEVSCWTIGKMNQGDGI